MSCLCCARADDGDPPAWKFTAGRYGYSAGSPGTDLNLRYSVDETHAWLGHFAQPGEGVAQWRSGVDSSLGSVVRLQPSLQVASGGFVGGSLGVETGETWVVSAGLGRTNLQPYDNLNFDPNDSYQLAAAWHGATGQVLGVNWVADNRQNPDQRHLHLLGQQPLGGGQRVSADLLYKRGLVNAQEIHRLGLGLTYDWPALFVRVVFDSQTNFTPVDALRISVGVRY